MRKIYKFDEEVVPNTQLYIIGQDDFDILDIKNKRFMYNPRNKELVLGSDKGGRDMSSSHAEEWSESGAIGSYDDAIKGWVGATKSDFPYGIIHFAPPVVTDNISMFNKAMDTLEMFLRYGAVDQTVVTGFGAPRKQTMGDII